MGAIGVTPDTTSVKLPLPATVSLATGVSVPTRRLPFTKSELKNLTGADSVMNVVSRSSTFEPANAVPDMVHVAIHSDKSNLLEREEKRFFIGNIIGMGLSLKTIVPELQSIDLDKL